MVGKKPIKAVQRRRKASVVSPVARPGRRRDIDNLDLRLGFVMHDVSRMRRIAFDQLMKPIGTTRSQWWVLAHLSRHDGMGQKELADLLDIGKVAIGGLVDRLESSKLVERRADAADRRIKRVYLTTAAQRLLEVMANAEVRLNSRLLHGISPKERARLLTLLEKIKHNLHEFSGAATLTEIGDDK
jgi:MarR family transcriptional regulator, transcriptional regulator for hemolysin